MNEHEALGIDFDFDRELDEEMLDQVAGGSSLNWQKLLSMITDIGAVMTTGGWSRSTGSSTRKGGRRK